MINKKNLARQQLYCPRGSESWCAWQRDVRDGTETYKNINCLPNVFFDWLKPIFLDLSDKKPFADVSKEQHKIQMKVSTVLSEPDVQSINSIELDQYSLLLLQLYLHLMEVQKGNFNSKTA